jgi:hypothetical protein
LAERPLTEREGWEIDFLTRADIEAILAQAVLEDLKVVAKRAY